MNFVILLWCFLAVFQKWETHGDTTLESNGVPDNITINAYPEARSFFLNWSVLTDYEYIFNYTISVIDIKTRHYLPHNCTPNIPGDIGNVDVTNFTYTEAVPDFDYFIEIKAYDINGTEQISGTANLTTLTTVPAAPRDVTVKYLQLAEDLNTFSAQVSWKTPCEPNGNLSYYQIFLYQTDAPSTSPINETVAADNQEEYTHVISSLQPNNRYNLVLFAVGSEKGGGENTSNYFFTDIEKLAVTSSANITDFSLTWNIPNSNCNVTYNIECIRLTPKHFVPQGCSIVIPDSVQRLQSTSYTYTEALADYEYELTIKAYCSNTNNLVANGSAIFSTYPTVPGAPTINNDSIFLYLNSDNTISLELSWWMPCQPNGDISMYKIVMNGEYIDDGDCTEKTLYVNAQPYETYYKVMSDELMPYSVYVIDVAAIGYENHVGNASERQTFETPSSFPGIPTVSIENKTSASFDITWTPPTNKPGPIRRYDLEVVPLGPQYDYDPIKCSSNNETQYYNTTNTSFQFTDGRPYFAYNVSVAAVTDAGTGVSGTQEVVTSSHAPAPPDDLNFVQNINTTYILTWTVPCQINGPLNHFSISLDGYYTEDNSYTNSNVLTKTFERDIFNYSTVIHLLESFHYTVKVSLVLDGNIIGEIAELDILTSPGIPGRPFNVTIGTSVLYSNSLIYWTPPVELKGKLSYEVEVTALYPLYQPDSSCRMPEYVTFNSSRLNITVLTLDLNPFYHYYNYSIAVRALTSAGPGDYKTIYENSIEGVPDNVFVEKDYPIISNSPTETYNATATIYFNPPCFLNGRFDNYTLDMTISNSSHVQISTTNNSFMFYLEPEKQYKYQIITHNLFGYNTSNIKTFQSPAGVPSINIVPHNISLGLKDTEAVVTLKKEDFEGPNGVVKYLALILTDRNMTGGKIEPYENGTWPNITNTQDGLYYQLTEDKWNPFNESNTTRFTIGDGADTCNKMASHCNRPLEPNTNYYLIIRVYTNDFYRNSPTIHFKTSNIKELTSILASISGVFLTALIGFLAFIFWRKKMIQLPGVLYIKSSENKHTPIINTAIPIKKFITYCKFLDNNSDKMKEQYILLTEQSKEVAATMTTNFAQLTENKRKNRYINILPYDETRVKLLIDEDDDLGSDYINASYIKGYSGQVEYIATQGPLEGTCRDFWKMILQENVSIIVMVSQFIENDRPKCYRYFPRNRDTMLLEDIEIRCSMELHFGIYCVRMLQVRKDNVQANVVHMQFLEWPDFGVPTGTENMLQFCYQIRDRINVEGGCAVIHCSAGVGRTGTLIATDILLQTAKAKKNIDVFNTVLELRKQRINMVQTEKQYIYIHHLLRDHTDRSPSPDYIVNSCPTYENLSMIKDKSDSEINGEFLHQKQPDGNVRESSF